MLLKQQFLSQFINLYNIYLSLTLTHILSLILQFEPLALIVAVRNEADKQLIFCGVHSRKGTTTTDLSIPSCGPQWWGRVIDSIFKLEKGNSLGYSGIKLYSIIREECSNKNENNSSVSTFRKELTFNIQYH